MKTLLIFLACLVVATYARGQHHELEEIEVTSPVYVGQVAQSLNSYLQSGIRYPSTNDLDFWMQGTVVIGFLVTPEGNLENFNIINGLNSEFDMEVIRVLKTTDGMWSPGIINGEYVPMPGEVSVSFKLNPDEDFIELVKEQWQKGVQALFVKNQPAKALKYFNHAISLVPNARSLLEVRGFCKYKMGDETGAYRDWDRLKTLSEKGNTMDIENLAKIPANALEYESMLRELIK